MMTIRMATLAVGLMLALLCSGGEARAQSFVPCEDSSAFAELQGSQCAVAAVPLNHARTDRGQVELFVRKFPAAAERRGQIWLVAGGPGESGGAFYPFLGTLRRAFPHHDLIMPDHRGTGYSSKLCPEQEAASSPDGLSLAGEEWGPCIGAVYQDQARAHAFTITNAAKDLSFLIGRYREPGEVQLYGVSYGTQLVLRMMQVAPPALDGMILDGLVPPESADQWDLSHRTAVIDATGRALLDADQEAAYAQLLVDAAPDAAWLDKVPGRNLRRFMGTLLTFPEMRARIPSIVDELARGETDLLERTIANLTRTVAVLGRYPQSSPSLPLVMLISGSENNARADLTEATVAAEAEGTLFVSPLAGFLATNPLPLYPRDAWFGGSPATLPRTLVIHGTLDPNTPYEGALAHVAALREVGPVQMSTVEGGAHFLLFVAPACFIRTTGAFVAGSAVPDTCVAD